MRDDVGDLLDPAERLAFETSPAYQEIRNRIDPDAWRRVWRLRAISFPRLGTPRTGPVSAANLLAKRKATMAFLHVHHDDLKHAIELAGPNRRNAQETWQRVFRDAERAVLRQTSSSFPELDHLPESMREIVLWQRRSFADQQGLYATACVQYRTSMNNVAEWAKALGYMDHTGAECIPTSSSLLHAYTREPDRVALLQRHDGYGPTLELAELGPADGALVYEISEEQYKPLLQAHPEWLDALATEMEDRLARTRAILTGDGDGVSIRERIRRRFFIAGVAK